MTIEGETKIISEMEDIKKMLSALITEIHGMRTIFSQYEQSYNEEILTKEGHQPH